MAAGTQLSQQSLVRARTMVNTCIIGQRQRTALASHRPTSYPMALHPVMMLPAHGSSFFICSLFFFVCPPRGKSKSSLFCSTPLHLFLCVCVCVCVLIAVCRKLSMIANSPMDVTKADLDQSPATATSSASPLLRPLLPAERDINSAMNGFNAGVVDVLKGKQYHPFLGLAYSSSSTAVGGCDVDAMSYDKCSVFFWVSLWFVACMCMRVCVFFVFLESVYVCV